MLVGVLALQGDFEEHAEALSENGLEVALVKSDGDLGAVDALVMPGGESTAIGKMLKSTGLYTAIQSRARRDMKVWGTCAGTILLANEVESKIEVNNLKLMDIKVSRNAYGNQLESFETELEVGKYKFPASFIRAPQITEVGEKAETLISFDGLPVLVRQDNILVSTFHTELYSKSAFYKWLTKEFLNG
jgi:5'-phosphate synthase pdxT subunit